MSSTHGLAEITDFFPAGKLKAGHFGEVHAGFHVNTGDKLVAKKFKEFQPDQEQIFSHDVSFFHRLQKHANIVTFHAVLIPRKMIFMEYEELQICGKIINDLLEYLIHVREAHIIKRKQRINVGKKNYASSYWHHTDLHSFIVQILEGCEYLHSKMIIHGDLAARNILMTRHKTIKLGDFGFLNMKKRLISSANGKSYYYRWAPPEIVRKWEFSSKSDVWSFGVVLWEIGTLGAHPYHNLSDDEVRKHKLQVKPVQLLTDAYLNLFTEKLKEIMVDCWSIQSEERPTLKALLEKFKMEKCAMVNEEQNCIYQNVDTLLSSDLEFLPTKEDLDEAINTEFLNFEKNILHLPTLKRLGEGKFGRVGKIDLKDPILGDITVSVKSIQCGEAPISSIKKSLFQEDIKNFEKIGLHKNIVKILAVCENPIAIMTEYQSLYVDYGKCEVTNLNQYLKYLRQDIYERARVNNQELGWFSIQIANGMKYLESLDIVHSNLTTKNVLINNAKILKITDFGKQGTGVYKSKDGTVTVENYRWAAPEIFLYGSYSSKSDVWAFAVVLWEIATFAAYPFGRKTRDAVISFVTNATGVLSRPKTSSPELWELMIQCWQEDPTLRPDFESIYFELNCIHLKKDIYVKFDTKNDLLLPTEEDWEKRKIHFERRNRGTSAQSRNRFPILRTKSKREDDLESVSSSSSYPLSKSPSYYSLFHFPTSSHTPTASHRPKSAMNEAVKSRRKSVGLIEHHQAPADSQEGYKLRSFEFPDDSLTTADYQNRTQGYGHIHSVASQFQDLSVHDSTTSSYSKGSTITSAHRTEISDGNKFANSPTSFHLSTPFRRPKYELPESIKSRSKPVGLSDDYQMPADYQSHSHGYEYVRPRAHHDQSLSVHDSARQSFSEDSSRSTSIYRTKISDGNKFANSPTPSHVSTNFRRPKCELPESVRSRSKPVGLSDDYQIPADYRDHLQGYEYVQPRAHHDQSSSVHDPRIRSFSEDSSHNTFIHKSELSDSEATFYFENRKGKGKYNSYEKVNERIIQKNAETQTDPIGYRRCDRCSGNSNCCKCQ